MADVRIIDLPAESSPTVSHELAVDLAETRKVTIGQIGDVARPFASQSEAEAGTDNTKTMTPLTSAQQLEAKGATLFASSEQGAKADSALQNDDVGALAFKSQVDIADINATGSATSTTFLAGNGEWTLIPGGGNMLSSVYDPDNVGAEMAFRSEAPILNTAVAAASITPAENLLAFRTNGYSLAGDAGGALYTFVDTEPTHEGKIQTPDGRWWEISEATVTPQMFGAKGDGTTDDIEAIEAMLASPFKHIDWGNQRWTYRVTRTINEITPDRVWFGSATLKLDRTGTFVVPLVIVHQTAARFTGGDDLVYDHDAEDLDEPSMVSSVSYPICQCFLHMADNSHIGGSFLNSFDNGLGIGSFDISGDGTAENPFDLTQHNSSPVGVSVGRVYGKNCGCGEHLSTPTVSKQGAPLNFLTADGVRIDSLFADQCYAGLIADYAGGASGVIGVARFKGTKLDSRNPGGTGMDVFVGSTLTIGALYSDNSQGQGVVVFNGAAVLTVGTAYIFASNGAGLRIGYGKVSGRFTFGNCGLGQTTINPDVLVDVATGASVLVDLDISSFGPYHTHSYYNNSNPGLVQGSVRVAAYNELTAPVFTRGWEHIETAMPKGGKQVYGGSDGFFAVGGTGIAGTLSHMQVASGLMLTQTGTTTISRNCYWDVAAANWKYSISGVAAQRYEFASDGTISEYYAPAGTVGGTPSFVLLFRRIAAGGFTSQLLPNFANDAAAATGGIPVGGWYRNGSIQMQRVS